MLPDVIVVGCGVQGLSIARHLARAGAHVVALDRVGPGTQTSRRAAGQSVIAQTDPAMGNLMKRSIEHITQFEATTGVPLPFHQVGSVKYAQQPWAAAQLEREVERASALGARISMIPLDRAAELAPHTNPGSALAAWHAPDDIYFEPADLALAMYEDAVRAGVEFRFGVEMYELVVGAGAVRGLHSDWGRFTAGKVVLASGAWTGPLLQRCLGIRLPLAFVRHQYSIRTNVPDIHPHLPSVRVVEHAAYARPVGTDLMFGSYEPHPLEFSSDRVPARTELVPLDPAALNEALVGLRDLLPGLQGSRIQQMRGGVVSMTPDGSYIVDEVEDVTGLFYLAGCNVMGLSVSPALGQDVATWVESGSRPESLSGFALSRFRESSASAEELHRRSLAEYEAIYRDEASQRYVRADTPSFGPERGARL